LETSEEIEQTEEKKEIESNAEGNVPGKDSFSFVSQKDYVPTPYAQTAWEGSDTYDRNPQFLGISLDVIAHEGFRIDPMFEVFQDTLETGTFKQYESEPLASNDEVPAISEEELQQLKESAFQDGVAVGKEEAQSEYKAELEITNQAFQEKIRELRETIYKELEDRFDKIEQNALNLSLAVSKKILDTTTEVRPDYIFEVIRKALNSSGGAKAVHIKLSPEDYEFISVEGVPDDITDSPLDITYVAEESITRGCILESEFGELNLEIDEMWKEVKDSLFAVFEE
jgi:flagellar biosynthesis/type III secretory pathway protein FliH